MENMPDRIEFTYHAEENRRIDLVLLSHLQAQNLNHLSRSQLQQLIEAGKVTVNNKPISKANYLVRPGACITFEFETLVEEGVEPYDFPLEVRYEDEFLIVIEKPAALTVHPGGGNKNKTLLNALVQHVQNTGLKTDEFSPGMPHRLDRDTTGLMVLSKTDRVKTHLSRQFAARQVKRSYLGLAFITPRSQRLVQREDSGRIDTFIGRHPHQRIKMAVLPEGQGRQAITNWKVVERYHFAVLLECRLETGRTHQIRAHLEHIMSPLLGDPLYGDFTGLPRKLEIEVAKFGRQALHARELEFVHPMTGKTMSFSSELPKDIKDLIELFKTVVA
jgi:23S rRNA pseudouridine1911/1915/1917 synthase